MTLYTSGAVDRLIERYQAQGGEAVTINEGVLGHGTVIIHGDGLKTAVIREQYINEWNSGHAVRFYNKMPAKYAALI